MSAVFTAAHIEAMACAAVNGGYSISMNPFPESHIDHDIWYAAFREAELHFQEEEA